MTEKNHEISTTATNEIKMADTEECKFTNKVVRVSAIACNRASKEDFDLKEAEEARIGLKALAAEGGSKRC